LYFLALKATVEGSGRAQIGLEKLVNGQLEIAHSRGIGIVNAYLLAFPIKIYLIPLSFIM
jgi:hypothetical protein